MKQHNKVVMFADLLGFAALTEEHELDAISLRNADRLDTMFGSIFNKNPLTNAFTEFHRAMKWGLQLSEMRHSSTAITFSDSAFVATTRLYEAAGIAIHLMKSLLRNEMKCLCASVSHTVRLRQYAFALTFGRTVEIMLLTFSERVWSVPMQPRVVE